MAAVAVASRLPFTLDEVEDIKLAVAEACNNAILHGARDPSPLPFVSVSFVALRDRLEICVSDRGRVADVDILRSPSASQRLASGQARENGGANDDVKRELPEGGLGLILIHALMDEVEVRGGPQEDTLVRMVKIAQQNVSRQRDNA
jgi:serine/threonine-protein kinase RsbW